VKKQRVKDQLSQRTVWAFLIFCSACFSYLAVPVMPPPPGSSPNGQRRRCYTNLRALEGALEVPALGDGPSMQRACGHGHDAYVFLPNGTPFCMHHGLVPVDHRPGEMTPVEQLTALGIDDPPLLTRTKRLQRVDTFLSRIKGRAPYLLLLLFGCGLLIRRRSANWPILLLAICPASAITFAPGPTLNPMHSGIIGTLAIGSALIFTTHCIFLVSAWLLKRFEKAPVIR